MKVRLGRSHGGMVGDGDVRSAAEVVLAGGAAYTSRSGWRSASPAAPSRRGNGPLLRKHVVPLHFRAPAGHGNMECFTTNEEALVGQTFIGSQHQVARDIADQIPRARPYTFAGAGTPLLCGRTGGRPHDDDPGRLLRHGAGTRGRRARLVSRLPDSPAGKAPPTSNSLRGGKGGTRWALAGRSGVNVPVKSWASGRPGLPASSWARTDGGEVRYGQAAGTFL
jgi:hypothetical protein